MQTESDDLLSVEQAAHELRLSRRAVQHRIKVGTLAAVKIGGGKTSAYVITRAEVVRVKGEVAA